MSRSGPDARRPPRAITPAGSSAPAARTRTSAFDHRIATRLVRLSMVSQALRSRRFYERIVVVVVVLRALGQMGQENRASTMARLVAWNKREIERLEHKAEHEARALKGTSQMAHSGASKHVAKKTHET